MQNSDLFGIPVYMTCRNAALFSVRNGFKVKESNLNFGQIDELMFTC